MKYHREKPLSFWLGWASVFLVAGLLVFPQKSRWPNDYYGFWAASQMTSVEGVTNIYSGSDSRRIAAASRAGSETALSDLERDMRRSYSDLDLTASPFHYTVYKLISTGNFERDYNRARLAGFVLYIAGIVAMAWFLKFPPWSFGIFVWAFTIPFFPFRRDVFDQNGSAAIAGAVMLGLVSLRWRNPAARVASGAALVMMAAFKPTVLYAPAFAFLIFALNDRKALGWYSIGLMAGVLTALFLPALVLGPTCTWQSWLAHAPHRAFEVRGAAGGILGRDLHVATILPYKIVSAVFLTTCVAFFYRLSGRTPPLVSDMSPFRPACLEAVSAGVIGLNVYLLTGVLVWGHYFTLAVPSMLIAMRPRSEIQAGLRPNQVIGFLCALAVGLQHYFQLWGWTRANNYSYFTLIGTLVLIILVAFDMHESRPGRTAG